MFFTIKKYFKNIFCKRNDRMKLYVKTINDIYNGYYSTEIDRYNELYNTKIYKLIEEKSKDEYLYFDIIQKKIFIKDTKCQNDETDIYTDVFYVCDTFMLKKFNVLQTDPPCSIHEKLNDVAYDMKVSIKNEVACFIDKMSLYTISILWILLNIFLLNLNITHHQPILPTIFLSGLVWFPWAAILYGVARETYLDTYLDVCYEKLNKKLDNRQEMKPITWLKKKIQKKVGIRFIEMNSYSLWTSIQFNDESEIFLKSYNKKNNFRVYRNEEKIQDLSEQVNVRDMYREPSSNQIDSITLDESSIEIIFHVHRGVKYNIKIISDKKLTFTNINHFGYGSHRYKINEITTIK